MPICSLNFEPKCDELILNISIDLSPFVPICDSGSTQMILVAALLYYDFNEAKPLGVVDLKSEAEIILFL